MRKPKTESRNQKLAIRNNQKSDYRKSRNWKLPKAESKSLLVFFFIILIVFYGGRYLGYHESREQTRELLSFLPIFRLRKVSFFSRRSSPGARFSKVPIINVPAKLLLFSSKIEVSIAWHLILAISWGNKMQ